MSDPGLIRHMERYLGPIDYGWSSPQGPQGIQAVRFLGQPHEGATTYTTLGMSQRVLPMPKNRKVRQELLIFAEKGYPGKELASFLLTFCEYVMSQKQALLRGDVVGPASPLIPDVRCNSVYASIPVMHADGLATYEGSKPATVFVWLVPLLDVEASYIRSNGWSRFEDILEAKNPDFGNLNRDPVL